MVTGNVFFFNFVSFLLRFYFLMYNVQVKLLTEMLNISL